MIRKLSHLVMVGFVGCALIAPLAGCGDAGSDSAPTIDTSSEIKAPGTPTTKSVEIKKPG